MKKISLILVFLFSVISKANTGIVCSDLADTQAIAVAYLNDKVQKPGTVLLINEQNFERNSLKYERANIKSFTVTMVKSVQGYDKFQACGNLEF